MNYLWNILKHHWQEDFEAKRFFAVFLFASSLTYLNYEYRLIKPNIIQLHFAWRIIPYFFLFGGVYVISAFIACKEIKQPKTFLFWVSICFFINAIDCSYIFLWLFKNIEYRNPDMRDAVINIANHSVSIFAMIVPMIIFYAWVGKQFNLPGFFGISFKRNASLKPYLIILGIMALLVGIAAFTSGISHYYPVMKRSALVNNAEALGLSKPLAILIFEAVYASDFISVELFFRGMLIFVFTRYLGNQVVLPMAACYMIFHFGKPLLEIFSSFFGGYLLGVFALHTRNIWGGIIVHVGTALLMEFFASIISN